MKYILVLFACLSVVPSVFAQVPGADFQAVTELVFNAGAGVPITVSFDFENDDEDIYTFDRYDITMPDGWQHLTLLSTRWEDDRLEPFYIVNEGVDEEPEDNVVTWSSDESTLSMRFHHEIVNGDSPALIFTFFAVAPRRCEAIDDLTFEARRLDGHNPDDEDLFTATEAVVVIPAAEDGYITMRTEPSGEGEELSDETIPAGEGLIFWIALYDIYGNYKQALRDQQVSLEWTGTANEDLVFDYMRNDTSHSFTTTVAEIGDIRAGYEELRIASVRVTVEPDYANARLIVTNNPNSLVHFEGVIELTCDEQVELWVKKTDAFRNLIENIVPGHDITWDYDHDAFDEDHLADRFVFLANRPGGYDFGAHYDGLSSGDVRTDVSIGRTAEIGLLDEESELVERIDLIAGDPVAGYMIIGLDADENPYSDISDPHWHFEGLDSAHAGDDVVIECNGFRQAPARGLLHIGCNEAAGTVTISVAPDEPRILHVSLTDSNIVPVVERWMAVGDTLDMWGQALDRYGNYNNEDVNWGEVVWEFPEAWNDDDVIDYPGEDQRHLRFTPQPGSGGVEDVFRVLYQDLQSVASGIVHVYGGRIVSIAKPDSVEQLLPGGRVVITVVVENLSDLQAQEIDISLEPNPGDAVEEIEPRNHPVVINPRAQQSFSFTVQLADQVDAETVTFTASASWQIDGNDVRIEPGGPELPIPVAEPPLLQADALYPSASTEGTPNVDFRFNVRNTSDIRMTFIEGFTWLYLYHPGTRESELIDVAEPFELEPDQALPFLTEAITLPNGHGTGAWQASFSYIDAVGGGALLDGEFQIGDFILYREPSLSAESATDGLTPGFPSELVIEVWQEGADLSPLTLDEDAIRLRLYNNAPRLNLNWELTEIRGDNPVLNDESRTQLVFEGTIPAGIVGDFRTDLTLEIFGECEGGKLYENENPGVDAGTLPILRHVNPVISGPAAEGDDPYSFYSDVERAFTVTVNSDPESADFILYHDEDDSTLLKLSTDENTVVLYPEHSGFPRPVDANNQVELQFTFPAGEFAPGDELSALIYLKCGETGAGATAVIQRAGETTLNVYRQPFPEPLDRVEEIPVRPPEVLTDSLTAFYLILRNLSDDRSLTLSDTCRLTFQRGQIISTLIQTDQDLTLEGGELDSFYFDSTALPLTGAYSVRSYLYWENDLGLLDLDENRRQNDVESRGMPVLSLQDLQPDASTEGTPDVSFSLNVESPDRNAQTVVFDENSTWLRLKALDPEMLGDTLLLLLHGELELFGGESVDLTTDRIDLPENFTRDLSAWFVYQNAQTGGISLGGADSAGIFTLFDEPEVQAGNININGITPGFPVSLNLPLSQEDDESLSFLYLDPNEIQLTLENRGNGYEFVEPVSSIEPDTVVRNDGSVTTLGFTFMLDEEMVSGFNTDAIFDISARCIGGKSFSMQHSLDEAIFLRRRVIPVVSGPSANEPDPWDFYAGVPREFFVTVSADQAGSDFVLHYGENDSTVLELSYGNQRWSVRPAPGEGPDTVTVGDPVTLSFTLDPDTFDPPVQLTTVIRLDCEERGAGSRQTFAFDGDSLNYIQRPGVIGVGINPLVPRIALADTAYQIGLNVQNASPDHEMILSNMSLIEFELDDGKVVTQILDNNDNRHLEPGESTIVLFDSLHFSDAGSFPVNALLFWEDQLRYEGSDTIACEILVARTPSIAIESINRRFLIRGESFDPLLTISLDADSSYLIQRDGSYFEIQLGNNRTSVQPDADRYNMRPGATAVPFAEFNPEDMPVGDYRIRIHLEGTYAGGLEMALEADYPDSLFALVNPPSIDAWLILEDEDEDTTVDFRPGESAEFKLAVANTDTASVEIKPENIILTVLDYNNRPSGEFSLRHSWHDTLRILPGDSLELTFDIRATVQAVSGYYSIGGDFEYSIPRSVDPRARHSAAIPRYDDAIYIRPEPILALENLSSPDCVSLDQSDVPVAFEIIYDDPTAPGFRQTATFDTACFQFRLGREVVELEFEYNHDDLRDFRGEGEDTLRLMLRVPNRDEFAGGELRIDARIEYSYGNQGNITAECVSPVIRCQRPPVMTFRNVEMSSNRLTAGQDLVRGDNLWISVTVVNDGQAGLRLYEDTLRQGTESALEDAGFDWTLEAVEPGDSLDDDEINQDTVLTMLGRMRYLWLVMGSVDPGWNSDRVNVTLFGTDVNQGEEGGPVDGAFSLVIDTYPIRTIESLEPDFVPEVIAGSPGNRLEVPIAFGTGAALEFLTLTLYDTTAERDLDTIVWTARDLPGPLIADTLTARFEFTAPDSVVDPDGHELWVKYEARTAYPSRTDYAGEDLIDQPLMVLNTSNLSLECALTPDSRPVRGTAGSTCVLRVIAELGTDEVENCASLLVDPMRIGLHFEHNGTELRGWEWSPHADNQDTVRLFFEVPDTFFVVIDRVGNALFDGNNPGEVECTVNWFGIEEHTEERRTGSQIFRFNVYDQVTPDYIDLSLTLDTLQYGHWNYNDPLRVTVELTHLDTIAEPAGLVWLSLSTSPEVFQQIDTCFTDSLCDGTVSWDTVVVFAGEEGLSGRLPGSGRKSSISFVPDLGDIYRPAQGFNLSENPPVEEKNRVQDQRIEIIARVESMWGVYSDIEYHPGSLEARSTLTVQERTRIVPQMTFDTTSVTRSILLHDTTEFKIFVRFNNLGEAAVDQSGRYNLNLPDFITCDSLTRNRTLRLDRWVEFPCKAESFSNGRDTIVVEITSPPTDRNSGDPAEIVSMTDNLWIEVRPSGFICGTIVLNPDGARPFNLSTGQTARIVQDGIIFDPEIIESVGFNAFFDSTLDEIIQDLTMNCLFMTDQQEPVEWVIQVDNRELLPNGADSLSGVINAHYILNFHDGVSQVIENQHAVTIHLRPALNLCLDGLFAEIDAQMRQQSIFKSGQQFYGCLTLEAHRQYLMELPHECTLEVFYPWGEDPGSADEVFDIALGDTEYFPLTAGPAIEVGEIGFRLRYRPCDVNTNELISYLNIECHQSMSVVDVSDTRLIAYFDKGEVIGGDNLILNVSLANTGAGLLQSSAMFDVSGTPDGLIVSRTVEAFLDETRPYPVRSIENSENASGSLVFSQIGEIVDSLSGEPVTVILPQVGFQLLASPAPVFPSPLFLELYNGENLIFHSYIEVHNPSADTSVFVRFDYDGFSYECNGSNLLRAVSYEVVSENPRGYAEIEPLQSLAFHHLITLKPMDRAKRYYLRTHYEGDIDYYFLEGSEKTVHLDENASDPLTINSPFPEILHVYDNSDGYIHAGKKIALVFSEAMNTDRAKLLTLENYLSSGGGKPLLEDYSTGRRPIYIDPSTLSWNVYRGKYRALEMEIRYPYRLTGFYNCLPVSPAAVPLQLDLAEGVPAYSLVSRDGMPVVRVAEADSTLKFISIAPKDDRSIPVLDIPRLSYRSGLYQVKIWVRDDRNRLRDRGGVTSTGISVFSGNRNTNYWRKVRPVDISFDDSLPQDLPDFERHNLILTLPNGVYGIDRGNSWLRFEVYDRARNVLLDTVRIFDIPSPSILPESILLYPTPYNPFAADKRLFIQFDAPENTRFDVVMTDINGNPVAYFFRAGNPVAGFVGENLFAGIEVLPTLMRHRHMILTTDRFEELPNGVYPVFIINNGSYNSKFIFSIVRGGVQ